MPKVIFEFNLPDEEGEFNIFRQAEKYHSALWEITQQFRSIDRYEEDKKKRRLDAEKIREIIQECLNGAGVEL